MNTVFYLASVVLSLYAAYLFTFRTYKADWYDGKQGERLTCPNIFYLMVFAASFIPFINVVLVLLATAAALMGTFSKDIYIDSWLFRKPKEENKED